MNLNPSRLHPIFTVFRLVASLLVLVSAACRLPAAETNEDGPPPAHRVDHTDTYHGVEVADPYRWLEKMDSAETKTWIRAQDAWVRRFIEAVPERDEIHRRIGEIADVSRYSVPVATGRGLVYQRGDGSFSKRWVELQPTGDGEEGVPGVILDPDTVAAEDGARISRAIPDRAGRWLAWSSAPAGSRWERWRVRDLTSGRDLADELIGLNSGTSAVLWAEDGSGFFYERFLLPEKGAELTQRLEGERLFFHRLATAQANDVLVYDPGDPQRALTTTISAEGRYLVMGVSEQGDPKNRVLVRDLESEEPKWLTFVPEADATYAFVGTYGSVASGGSPEGDDRPSQAGGPGGASHGPGLWFYTNLDAPRGRVIAIDLDSVADGNRSGRSGWREVIPGATDTIDTWILARAVGDRLVVGYRKDAWLAVKVLAPDGRLDYELKLPKVGSIWSFSGRQGDPEAYFSLSDFTDPGTIYRLEVASGEISVFRRPQLAYDPEDFVTRQVFFDSKDGTRIPMFVAHRKGLQLDGDNPTFLYGYGAFNWAASPWFQPHVTAWLQMGGVYALPNIRGGGEFGEQWHRAGVRRNKQNSIDDYLAAAEWLIANRYTSSRRLVANGGSASGPLVGAALVQRPKLFAAALIDFPALDMLRLEEFTGGRRWRSDFGTTADPEDFQALLAYSPYHNVEPGVCYPATLIAPGERDETTVPMHAYKFTAALQHAQRQAQTDGNDCRQPILLRVSWGAGHSYGASNEDSMDTWADQLAFLVQVLESSEVAPPGQGSGGRETAAP